MAKLLPVVTYGYTILIVVASLGKFVIGFLPKGVAHSDKIGHFIAYMLFSFLWGLYFYREKGVDAKKSMMISLLMSVFFGIFMEFCQWIFTSYRQFDYYDMLANSLGGLLGMLILSVFLVFMKKRQL